MENKKEIKIIDIHMHLGPCNVFDCNIEEGDLFKAMEDYNIETFILQLLPGVADYKKGNDRILDICKNNKGKFYGIVAINPHITEEDYFIEVERLLKTGYFKGIKLNSAGWAVNPLSNDATKVFMASKKYGVPLMCHTGVGIPWALPSMLFPRAKEYPDLNIVVAHAGNTQNYATEALIGAQLFDNMYLETSWTSISDKLAFFNSLGSKRILFGSDVPLNTPGEICHYKSLNLKDTDLKNIFSENAKNLYKI
jgi:Predicted metal-dependent hydrolase of the TIM-barrel fold